jgi:Omp85 superfamily domain
MKRRGVGRVRRLAGLVALLVPLACPPAIAQEPTAAPDAAVAVPTFAELEAAGATIGEIRLYTRDIFDTDTPEEDKLLFRWANALHIQTREGVIRRALLFKTGESVSVRLIDETERLLRGARYLQDVHIRPAAVRDGVIDIDVETRDTWTLDPGLSAGRSGGANSSGIRLSDYNFLGTGVSFGVGRSKNVDRSSTEFQMSNDRAFGGWTSLSYTLAQNSDGKRESASVAHPFYALDTPWAAGISVSRDNRIDAVYNAGVVTSRYRHRQNIADAFAGWSSGRVDGWVNRYSIGVRHQEDAFAAEPGPAAAVVVPTGERLIGTYLRHELIEDRFARVNNRNQIGRPEFFALGFASTVQLGRADTGWGSTSNAWLYSGSVSRGFEPAPEHTLLASAAFTGQYLNGQVRRQRLGGQVQYFLPQSPTWLFYASAAADTLKNPDAADSLQLGGDSGLRGYPMRFQSGDRRALITLEERFYTDLYLWRLFRLGGAAFFDTGRAWGGANVNIDKPGWLNSIGVGLRIFSVRAAFSNVLHVDLAFPLDPDTHVKRMQLLVKTKTSF